MFSTNEFERCVVLILRFSTLAAGPRPACARACGARVFILLFIFLRGIFSEQMEGSAVTGPVPTFEVREITSAVPTGPQPAEPTASDGSGGGDGSAASSPWSLTHEQQVQKLKENLERALEVGEVVDRLSYWTHKDIMWSSAWFERVVEKLRGNPCVDSSELEIEELPIRLSTALNSLDLAILMGDLKMVQTILGRGQNQTPGTESHQPTSTFPTPLHVAACRDSQIVDAQIKDALTKNGADVNVPNSFGQTPLDLACNLGNVTVLQQLLAKDEDMRDPLHVAVRCGDIDFIKKLPSSNVKAEDCQKRTPLHYLATTNSSRVREIVQYFAQNPAQNPALDMTAYDSHSLTPFYLAVLTCNTRVVIALLDFYKDKIQLNEECTSRGPPIQIASEQGIFFEGIRAALMECDPVKGYIETLYRDRQVYVDAANAILVGAALIASVTFASWLQPPLSYTSYSGEAYSSSVPAPSTSDLNYVDVEHNTALRAFWVFNSLSFYFAIATVVCGAQSVLPRSHLFIKKTVGRLSTNLLVTSILLACSMLFVIIAFAIAGTIVLTPLVKYQWYMIGPTIVGGIVCLVSLGFLAKNMGESMAERFRLLFGDFGNLLEKYCDKHDAYLAKILSDYKL